MHELSIALGILEVTQEESERRGGVRVDAIHLRLGPLSGVVKEALLSAWQLASEQTEFATSRLVIEEVPIAVFCSKCQAERPVQSIQQMCCVECDTPAAEVMHGRELLVSALELAG
ncbi:MAG: hydrogenase maturation nickel metallochaperone HypA [Bryobacteraceae bacterium]|jgi:hydrogenase nickel incorporation protein HypA/HybF